MRPDVSLSAAWFLDRDGTLIEHVPYLADPARVTLVPGTREALAYAVRQGIKLFLFTNQSGVGRGLFGLDDVQAVNRHMLELIGLGADLFTATCIAPEAPDEPSAYRKPSPAFIQESIERHGLAPARCWMVGDRPVDWNAGGAAGIGAAAIVRESDPAPVEPPPEVPRFASLWDFVQGTYGSSPQPVP